MPAYAIVATALTSPAGSSIAGSCSMGSISRAEARMLPQKPAIARSARRISSSGLSVWSLIWEMAFLASVEEYPRAISASMASVTASELRAAAETAPCDGAAAAETSAWHYGLWRVFEEASALQRG